MILKRTLQSICILTINPNTTTSIIIQVSFLHAPVFNYLLQYFEVSAAHLNMMSIYSLLAGCP